MIRTWTVNPGPEWLRLNERWLHEANLPDTELCAEVLLGTRCELIAKHECPHMVYMKARPSQSVGPTISEVDEI